MPWRFFTNFQHKNIYFSWIFQPIWKKVYVYVYVYVDVYVYVYVYVYMYVYVKV